MSRSIANLLQLNPVRITGGKKFSKQFSKKFAPEKCKRKAAKFWERNVKMGKMERRSNAQVLGKKGVKDGVFC